jgi:septal ring factor EnvC (AmiA/AmiB activator)
MVRLLHFSKTVLTILTAVNIIFTFQPIEAKGAKPREIGIVTTKRLNIRPEPGIMKPPLKVIERGTKVYILEHTNGWVKIKHGPHVGYIRNLKRFIRIISIGTPSEKLTGDSDHDIKQFKKEAEDISQKIKKGKTQVLTFTKKEASIVSSLNDIDLSINNIRKQISAIKSELAFLGKRIEETNNLSKDLKKKVEIHEGYASKRLVALYKLSWLGKIHALASAQSVYDLFQRQNTIERILTYDENIRQNLLNNNARLQKLMAKLNQQKLNKLSLESDLKKQMALMSIKRAQRSKLLDDIRNKRALEMATIDILKAAAADLDRTIESIRLTPYSTKTNTNILSKSFTSLKGLLNMPVKGKIISFFGPFKNKKFNVINFQSGIKIKSDRGEPIRAVSDGHVLYASWFKGYGNMIIIDHGDSYYTVYAHAEELFTTKGTRVETGQVVATVGDSGSMIGPNLHFEIRHHGKPIDPLKWIKKG